MTSKGKAAPEIIELNETYFVMKSVNKKIPRAITVGRGAIARMMPNRHATPFPPLKPANTGKM